MDGVSSSLHNQILAVKRRDLSPHVPAGFRRVTADGGAPSTSVLEVYVGPKTTLQIASDPQADFHVYLWGLAAHPLLQRSEIPHWIARKTVDGDVAALREIVGSYIALIDDRRNSCVAIVSDVTGTRPFFAGQRDGAIVCGSDVWTMAEHGWIDPKLNYDAIAAWIRAGYDMTEGSVFFELSLVEPGAVTSFFEGRICEKSYVQFQGGCANPTADDFIENIHDIMVRSFRTVTRELGAMQLALSGGFDSRYLAALAMSQGSNVRAVCLKDNDSEGIVAADVARRLDLPLKTISTDGSRWNAYDEPYHFSPSGFPISKQQTYPAAMQNAGMPCLNGFLGDVMIRGEVDRLEGKLPSETTDDLAKVYQRAQTQTYDFARFDLMEAGTADRCDQRALPACRRHIERYAHTANVFASAMCLRRHRGYFGNNFVQHLAFAEPILPFANYELAQYKCQTRSDCFTRENYETLLGRFFPRIAGVPHNDKSGDSRPANVRRSAATPRWAMNVLRAMVGRNGLRILDSKKTIPRLIGALRGGNKADVVALFTYRLYLLERRLRDLDVELNWEAI